MLRKPGDNNPCATAPTALAATLTGVDSIDASTVGGGIPADSSGVSAGTPGNSARVVIQRIPGHQINVLVSKVNLSQTDCLLYLIPSFQELTYQVTPV